MRVYALTGNIAAGKSSVADILRTLGARVIDLDAEVHALQQAGTPVFKAIISRFGSGILTESGALNRPALRQMILGDPDARHDLEAIVHPAVAARQGELIDEAAAVGAEMVVVEIPLLFEAATPSDYDGVLLVDAPEAVRRTRLMTRPGIGAAEADHIMAMQLPAAPKRALATWVVDNDRDLTALRAATTTIWQAMQR